MAASGQLSPYIGGGKKLSSTSATYAHRELDMEFNSIQMPTVDMEFNSMAATGKKCGNFPQQVNPTKCPEVQAASHSLPNLFFPTRFPTSTSSFTSVHP
eukprot:362351-Chlamydomonas_euryale.AAC.2